MLVAAPSKSPFEEEPAAEAPSDVRMLVKSIPLSFDVIFPIMVGSSEVATLIVESSRPNFLAAFFVKSCVANCVIGLDSAEVLPVNYDVICSIPLAD